MSATESPADIKENPLTVALSFFLSLDLLRFGVNFLLDSHNENDPSFFLWIKSNLSLFFYFIFFVLCNSPFSSLFSSFKYTATSLSFFLFLFVLCNSPFSSLFSSFKYTATSLKFSHAYCSFFCTVNWDLEWLYMYR